MSDTSAEEGEIWVRDFVQGLEADIAMTTIVGELCDDILSKRATAIDRLKQQSLFRDRRPKFVEAGTVVRQRLFR